MSGRWQLSHWTLLLVLGGAGCSHLTESRAVSRFAEGLEAKDMEVLRTHSSEHFASRALRTSDAMEDLDALRLPDGKSKVVAVEEKGDGRKRVTVTVGEREQEVFYELVRTEEGRWVVDDLYLKQQKQGVTTYKSISEQLDLLLSVRGFVNAWTEGDRDAILASTAPEFREPLMALPPAYLVKLCDRVAGSETRNRKLKPQAQITEDVAVVKLSRADGELVLTLKQNDGHWQVEDAALDARKEEDRVPSVAKLALAIHSCSEFLQAYEANELARLKGLSTNDFYEGCLMVGNLQQVSLPPANLGGYELEATLRTGRADFLLRSSTEIVQINMQRTDSTDGVTPTKFAVSDITLYDLNSKQEKRLSALFTSKEMLRVFSKALAERDLKTLRHSSTKDLTDRVWLQLNPATIEQMPLEPFAESELTITGTTFEGSLTRIDCKQGGAEVAYLLREESGRFYVDDVHWHVPGRPDSMKATLEVMIPVINFASAVALSRDANEQLLALDVLRKCSSEEFNRTVWMQTEFVPSSGLSADTFLQSQVRSLAMAEEQVLVSLGDNRYGAQVTLRKEYGRFVVDDVMLVAGPAESQRLTLKPALRNQLSHGIARAPRGNTPQIAVTSRNAPEVKTASTSTITPASPSASTMQTRTAKITPPQPGSAANSGANRLRAILTDDRVMPASATMLAEEQSSQSEPDATSDDPFAVRPTTNVHATVPALHPHVPKSMTATMPGMPSEPTSVVPRSSQVVPATHTAP